MLYGIDVECVSVQPGVMNDDGGTDEVRRCRGDGEGIARVCEAE